MMERLSNAGKINPDGTVVPDWTPAERKEHAYFHAEFYNLENDPNRPEGMDVMEWITRNHSGLSESERIDRLRLFGFEQDEEEGEEG